MPAAPDGVESVERALAILKAFDDGCTEMRLAELSKKTGLYKSTILRLSASLEVCGFLWRDAEGTFRLGPELWRLGALYRRGFDLGRLIRPVLARLAAETQETASFYVRDGDQRICLYRVNSPRAARHHLDEGVRFPIARGASGRVLSAFGMPEDPEGEAVRRQGYSISLGERDAEIAAAAVPLFDQGGRLLGSLSISGLIARFDAAARDRAVTLLGQAAQQLHAALPGTD